MPRGREYYDPIVQVPSRVQSAADGRIELYPEQDVRDNTVTLRWVGRLVADDGRIIDKAAGSFDHDDALGQAQELWPGLQVFELREESEDSTHDGFGPSPRLWQTTSMGPAPLVGVDDREWVSAASVEPMPGIPPAVDEVRPGDMNVVHAMSVPEPGTYVLLSDVCLTLEYYARQFDGDNNPSAALGLREAAAALRGAF